MLARPAPRVLVTAAGTGIGREIAEAFSREGARVHVCDIDAASVADLRATGRFGTTEADVSSERDVERLFRDVDRDLGGLDVLVNNAGTSGPTGPVESLDFTGWRRTLEVNLDSQFLCARLAVPRLLEAGGGSIVNMSSSAGLHGYPLRSPYATAKWGVIGLTKTLAMELGPSGIRVNAICPGSVAGERIERVMAAEAEARGATPDEVRSGYLRQVSMRTFVHAADVAALVLFLCSEGGSRISGQALGVDGFTEGLSIPDWS
jgi:NAD(P)-dependent dehydrogenase (short-subunit alcohol dehydrogenase family)